MTQKKSKDYEEPSVPTFLWSVSLTIPCKTEKKKEPVPPHALPPVQGKSKRCGKISKGADGSKVATGARVGCDLLNLPSHGWWVAVLMLIQSCLTDLTSPYPSHSEST